LEKKEKLPTFFHNLPVRQTTPEKSFTMSHKYRTSPWKKRVELETKEDPEFKQALTEAKKPKPVQMTQIDQVIQEILQSIVPFWVGVHPIVPGDVVPPPSYLASKDHYPQHEEKLSLLMQTRGVAFSGKDGLVCIFNVTRNSYSYL
jgi:hypothetical protein